MIDYAHAIKTEALRLLGQILKANPMAKGARGQLAGRDASGASLRVAPEDGTPTLASTGISFKTSALAQKLAELPEKQFQEVCEGKKSVTEAIREVLHAQRPARPVLYRQTVPRAVLYIQGGA